MLDLRETFNVTTAATCKISEFITDILRIEWELFAKAIEKSLLRNESLDSNLLNFETKEILHSESPFTLFKHVQDFVGKRLCQSTSSYKKTILSL